MQFAVAGLSPSVAACAGLVQEGTTWTFPAATVAAGADIVVSENPSGHNREMVGADALFRNCSWSRRQTARVARSDCRGGYKGSGP